MSIIVSRGSSPLTAKMQKACCECVKPENAARFFLNPAPLLEKQKIVELLKAKSGGSVLELGAGCLRNALFLTSKGFKVSVVEVPAMEARFPEAFARFRKAGGTVMRNFVLETRFDIVVATFVIETICDSDARRRMLCKARECLKPKGFLLMSVRGYSDVVTARARGKRCGDDWITPNRTFARPYSKLELQSLLRHCGFAKLEFLHRQKTKTPELLHVVAWRH